MMGQLGQVIYNHEHDNNRHAIAHKIVDPNL
jgi:hypothetical protein